MADRRFLVRGGRPKGLNRDPFPPKGPSQPSQLAQALASALKDKYRVGTVLGSLDNHEFEDLDAVELAKFLDEHIQLLSPPDLDEHSESPSSGQL